MRIADFELERYFAKYEFSVRHLLSSSDAETWTVEELLALEPGAREALLGLRLGYVESSGGHALRSEISRLYGLIAPDEVLAHAGAQEAILGFMNTALDPGDRVIVHVPSYQSLHEVARAVGCEVLPWEARPENGWEPALEDLDRLMAGGRARAVVVNSPHNPTGWVASSSWMGDLVTRLRRDGILLFSDEVYRGTELDKLAPAACDLYENAVSLGVMSKSYGLAGLRVGWVASRRREILARMAAFKDYTTICNSGPSEHLAALALRHGARILERNREILAANLRVLSATMGRRGDLLEWVPPRGGTMAFPRFRDGRDAGSFAERLVRERGVMLLPGRVLGSDPARFRVGFGRRDFPEVLGIFEKFLCS